MLYDVTTPYFETDKEDELRTWFSTSIKAKAKSLLVCSLMLQNCHYQSVRSVGNDAETQNVADADMFPGTNTKAIVYLGLHYILGPKRSVSGSCEPQRPP